MSMRQDSDFLGIGFERVQVRPPLATSTCHSTGCGCNLSETAGDMSFWSQLSEKFGGGSRQKATCCGFLLWRPKD